MATKTKKRKSSAQDNIVYTQPAPFRMKKFLLKVLIVLSIVIAILLVMSIFFKVKHVEVSGTDKYSAYDIRVASGIQDGESLWSLSGAQVSGRIITELPYVKQVRMGIKLPDTVQIYIEELKVTYAAQATDESWWLLSADGKVVDTVNFADAQSHTQILGIRLADPKVGQAAVAEEVGQDATGETVTEETAPVTVKGSERLAMVVSVMKNLEEAGILGEMKSIDVTNVGHIELWYGDRFQIDLGDQTDVGFKIKSAKAAIDDPEMGEYATGKLDASFTIWPDVVAFSQFDQ